MNSNKNTKKFPISINNQQCIGPCYPSNKIVLHPITLNYLTNKEPFCPTLRWYDERDHQYKNADICLIPSDTTKMDQQQIDLDLIVPTFYFNCEYFLKAYYDIYSFENAIEWISINNKDPLYTLLRIINCSWRVFGPDIDIMNDQLIEFYSNVIKKNWIKDIYPEISKYIYIDSKNKNIFLKEVNNIDEPNQKNQIEKINYFNKKFNTSQVILNLLKIYISENKNDWNKIINHNNLIKIYYKKFVINKIKTTLQENK